MEQSALGQAKKVVRVIPATVKAEEKTSKYARRLRVVAYCRVSTKQEEQLNSYETQLNYYTDRINREPDWEFVGIYADKGITGTSVKNRDEFKKMIQLCKKGKVDMIITKSISRFARNTLDCLKYTRMLKELNVDVYFEEQGLHSKQQGSEFYITIYGSIAQSESENISANVIWGKNQAAKEGKAPFFYKNFLGYYKGADGLPAINEEEAKVIRMIYDRYLKGDSLIKIKNLLEDMGVKTPKGGTKWHCQTIQSILTNERYKGDVIINKTYVVDCISKEVRVNNGERPKYYVENNHPAIIDSLTFAKVQEEVVRRAGKPKLRTGGKTEFSKYSSKYALTEKLICGECKAPFRRCTWVKKKRKKVMWRCISRLDHGTKYCHSPSIEEKKLQDAIMRAMMETAKQNLDLFRNLKLHIAMGLQMDNMEDKSYEIEVRIAEIDAEITTMINAVSADTIDAFDENRVHVLVAEKEELRKQLSEMLEIKKKREITESRLDNIYMIMDALKNHPLTYDDELVRQMIEWVVVESAEKIKVVFVGGLETIQTLV